MDKDLKNNYLNDLDLIIDSFGEKRFLSKIIFNWIHAKQAEKIEQMTNISKKFRDCLSDNGFFISNLKISKKLEDADGTIKYLFELSDGRKTETVLLDDKGRKTLCISTQVGCKMNCAFCATAHVQYKRNLTAAEIVDQVIQVEKDLKEQVSNVVYMGMGEPLDNYEEVIKSLKMLNDQNGRNIGARHLTISTCGIIPGINKLAEEKFQVRLAVSLHGHTDAIRSKLMPVNKKYPVAELIQALKNYQKNTNRRITFEYVMIKGVNDSRAHARGLMKLISGIKANVNLIEYNSHDQAKFQSSVKETIKEFKWLLNDRGFEVNIRYKRGQKINAACGQLGAETYE